MRNCWIWLLVFPPIVVQAQAPVWGHWEFPQGRIAVVIGGWSYENPDRIAGVLINGTTFRVDSAEVHLTRFADRVRLLPPSSPIGLVSTVPPGGSALFAAYLTPGGTGCTAVLQGVEIVVDGQLVPLTLQAPSPPLWFAGNGCFEEARGYKKAMRTRGIRIESESKPPKELLSFASEPKLREEPSTRTERIARWANAIASVSNAATPTARTLAVRVPRTDMKTSVASKVPAAKAKKK